MAFQVEMNHMKRFNFMKKNNNSYSNGQDAYIKLVNFQLNSQWHITDIVLQTMTDYACGPVQMLKRFKRWTVCVPELWSTKLH